MNARNNVMLIGNLTRDPELKESASGVQVCRITLAVQRAFKNSEGNYDADFVPCIAFKATADLIAKYTVKGQRISVIGEFRSNPYKDREGNNRTAYEVIIDSIALIGQAPEKKEEPEGPTGVEGFIPVDAELPF